MWVDEVEGNEIGRGKRVKSDFFSVSGVRGGRHAICGKRHASGI